MKKYFLLINLLLIAVYSANCLAKTPIIQLTISNWSTQTPISYTIETTAGVPPTPGGGTIQAQETKIINFYHKKSDGPLLKGRVSFFNGDSAPCTMTYYAYNDWGWYYSDFVPAVCQKFLKITSSNLTKSDPVVSLLPE